MASVKLIQAVNFGRASGKRGIDIIHMKKINPVLRSNALSTMQPR
jgi:hypothetical protein